jgi:hypothetical protein
MSSPTINPTNSDANMLAIDDLLAQTAVDPTTTNSATSAADEPSPDFPITPAAPLLVDFATLSASEKGTINRIIQEIGTDWGVLSVATPFPGEYLPDPEPNTWGVELLSAIRRLVWECRREGRDKAVEWVVESIRGQNRGELFG